MTYPAFDVTRGARLGAFGTEYGGYIELYGDWVPTFDPDDAAALMLGVAGYILNIETPLEMAQKIAIDDTRKRFATETDPEENRWIGLSDKYRQEKLNHGFPDYILTREGHLGHAAASDQAWKIFGPTLVFDASVLPKDPKTGANYGEIMQAGGSEGREFIPKPHFEFVPGQGQVEIEGTTKTGQGLPPRPFIGLSNEGVAKIEAAFASWFEAAPIVGGFFRAGGYQAIVKTSAGARFGGFVPAPAMTQGM